MDRKRRAWIKVWIDWYTSDSHAGLDGVALNIGPRLMLLADRSWNRDEPHADLLHPSGRPYSVAEIAAFVRFDVETTAAALAALVEVGTLADVGYPCDAVPGTTITAYRFPRFGLYQETADAARKRKARGRTVRGQSDLFPREVEGEADADADADDSIARIVARVNEHRTALGRKPVRDPSTKRRSAILARIAETDLATALAVVDNVAAEAKSNPDSVRWLDLLYPFRPTNYERRLGWLDAPAPKPTGAHRLTAEAETLRAIGGVE